MKTNFFELVAGLGFKGNLRINIHQEEDGLQTVSVLLDKNESKATAANLPPLVFKGTAQELNDAFFEALAQPVKQTVGLMSNLEAYQKELEKAKKNAKPDKAKSNKATATEPEAEEDDEQEENTNLFTPAVDDKQAKAEKKKLYDEAMEKVKELARQMKYAEALAQLPDPAEYADKAELIEAKRQEIQAGKDLYDKLAQQFND